MAGDYTRATFRPRRDHAGVLMQQGRVTLDADWNELVELIDRRLRAETIDIIGRCVVPMETPDGFRISLAGGNVMIGRGRAYVHGILAECHGVDPTEYDRVLGEVRGTQPIPWDKQPYFPNAAAIDPPPATGTHLVYLDVWRREVTHLEEPELIEKAIAVDTATRLQTAWQVRLLKVPRGTTCDSEIRQWANLTAPSAGRLTTNAVGVPVDDDPCTVPPTGGYRGTENRLYRVEIHDEGPLGTATFKWSRDNASIAFPVTGIDAARKKLTVTRVGRDSVARISIGDWVEVIDDWRELNGLPGELRKVADVDDGDETITLDTTLPTGAFDPLDVSRHTRVRKWDQSGVAVDAAAGVVPVPAAAGTAIVLEDGVEVSFSVDGTPASFHVGDYWIFAARTTDASVEILTEEPPRGILHHFCRLAVITFPSTVVDCRTFWPPDFGGGEGEGHDCGCAACVTPESHASGKLTIQKAVDKVKVTGGKVCLQPGFYFLDQAVRIDGAQSLALEGKGWRTILVSAGREPAIVVERSLGVTIDSLTVLTSTFTSPDALPAGIAIELHNTIGTVIERCVLAQLGAIRGGGTTGLAPSSGLFAAGPGTAGGPLVALDGIVVETLIHENVLVGTTGIGAVRGKTFTPLGFGRMDPGVDDGLRAGLAAEGSGYVLTFDFVVEENFILAFLNGVSLEGFMLNVGEARIVRNSLLGALRVGIVCNGLTLPMMTRVDVASNLLQVFGFGIAIGTDDTRIADNDVYGLIAPRGTGEGSLAASRLRPDAIVLIPSLRPSGIDRTQVRGNRIGRILGHAISVRTDVISGQIAHNTIQGTGLDGIAIDPSGSAEALVVEGNQVFNVSTLEEQFASSVGITLQNGVDVAAIGNTVHGVGGRLSAGIAAFNCQRVRIADNDIGDVGGLELARGFGILVSGDRVDVLDNSVRRFNDPGAKPSLDTRWWGIMVAGAEPKRAGEEPELGLADIPGFTTRAFALGDSLTTIAFDTRRGRAVELPRRRPSVAIQGNRVEGAGASHAVEVITQGQCSFSDNRCFYVGRESLVARVAAGALVASDNYLEGEVRVPAAEFTLSGGAGFTISGNLSSGPIQLNGAPLPPPWNQLNVP